MKSTHGSARRDIKQIMTIAATALLLAMPGYSEPSRSISNLQQAIKTCDTIVSSLLPSVTARPCSPNAGVASLLRAVSASSKIHREQFVGIVTSLGAQPIMARAGKHGTANTCIRYDAALKSSASQLRKLVNTDYPKYLKEAAQDGIRSASFAFTNASITDKAALALIDKTSKNKRLWNVVQPYYVCPSCGYIVTKLCFQTCVVCAAPKDKFITIK